MKVAGYAFSDSRFQSGAILDAAAVGAHLEYLRKESKGELTPHDVVKDARSHNSPLHSFFEWDDGKAAEQHRLAQARGLIRAVVAIYTQPDKPAKRVKAFVHIAEAGAPHYRSMDHAMSQKKTRDIVLKQAWRELQSWRRRYSELQQFASLFEEMDEVAKKLPALQG